MSRSSVLFKIIDVMCHPGQNYRKYSGISIVKNIPYEGEHRLNKGDIYYDEKFAGNKYPVVLNIHGGGFSAGDKRHRKSLSSYYASKGFFVYNINYRLGPKYVFPAQCIDATNALNKIADLEEEYNLDMDKIIVTGDSAGAYLASYLVALYANEDLAQRIGAPQIKVKIKGLLSFCGLYNLVETLKHPIPFGLTRSIGQDFLGHKFTKDLSNYVDYHMIEETSPSNFVNEKWCSSLIVMAGKDFFCGGQGEDLEKRLIELNVPVKAFRTEKFADNHCFHLEFYRKQSKLCFVEVEKFLEDMKQD